MKRAILAAIAVTMLSVSVVSADNLQPAAPVTETGSPGTATPTPYPQVAPPSIPRAGSTEGNGPLLPKIDMPKPPRDQTLPGLESNAPAPTTVPTPPAPATK
ncbi:Uncharacterised protein [Paucimonas lemoignei]|nr:Uncharacterised protein [Paucimonas lemoignei]